MGCGHVEAGETAVDAVIREADEKLGVALAVDDVEAVTVMQRSGGDDPIEQRVDWFFIATAWRGEPSILEPAKCEALAWHRLDALPANVPGYERLALDAVARGERMRFIALGYGA